MRTIILRRDVEHDCWTATEDSPRIRPLFGTDTLPLPFSARATADVVMRETVSRNPDASVVLG